MSTPLEREMLLRSVQRIERLLAAEAEHAGAAEDEAAAWGYGQMLLEATLAVRLFKIAATPERAVAGAALIVGHIEGLILTLATDPQRDGG